jgi:hypothetical protein
MCDLKPNPAEQVFLSRGYNRFLDLYKEIEGKPFWEQTPLHRFHRIRDIFAVYTELIQYEAIEHILDLKKASRPVEHDLGERLFSFVRHLLAHFPLFDSWDTVSIDQQLATWERKGQIHKFLTEFEGKPQVKYRFYDSAAKEMIYVTINFPINYTQNRPIALNSILGGLASDSQFSLSGWMYDAPSYWSSYNGNRLYGAFFGKKWYGGLQQFETGLVCVQGKLAGRILATTMWSSRSYINLNGTNGYTVVSGGPSPAKGQPPSGIYVNLVLGLINN